MWRVPSVMAEDITNQVRWIRGIFKDVTSRNLHSRARELEDHRFYSAINNGQWTQSAINTMVEQGRAIITWNFIKKHIDTESGMLLQNPFEFNFASEIGQDDSDAELMNELRFRDKDLGRWGAQKTLFTIDGMINTGVMEVFIDKNKDRMGAINYRRRVPTDFHFDPDWRSNNVQDNRQIFEAGYYDIVKIVEDWGNTLDKKIEIQEAFKTWEQQRAEQKVSKGVALNGSGGRGTGVNDTRSAFLDMPEELNGKFLTLQMQELQDISVNKIFNRGTGQFLKERMDDFEFDDKRLAFQMLQDREQADLVEIPVNEKKLVVKTVAPGLSQELFLANGPHEVQIGNYPLSVWSAYNMNGQRYGKVSQLKDPQSVANTSRAIWLKAQSIAGRNNKFIGPGAFDDDGEQKRYEDTRSRGGGNFNVANANEIVNEENGNPPQELEQSFNDAIAFGDKIGAPLAAQGSAKSGTSGILFNAEREQAAVSLIPLNDGLEKIENDMGEQYIDLALSHYGDDIARRFKSLKDKDKNVFINMDDTNRIKNMSRMSVRIDQAPVGASVKRENLQIIATLKQQATSPLEAASLGVLAIPLIPGLTEENKESMLKDAEQALETARAQDLAIRAQSEAVIQQSGGGQQPGAPTESQDQQPQDPELEALIQQVSGNDELSQGSETQGII